MENHRQFSVQEEVLAELNYTRLEVSPWQSVNMLFKISAFTKHYIRVATNQWQ